MTIAWSPRVGQIWRMKDSDVSVEIIGDHLHARLVHLREVASREKAWVPFDALDSLYEPASCKSCGSVLTNKQLAALTGT